MEKGYILEDPEAEDPEVEEPAGAVPTVIADISIEERSSAGGFRTCPACRTRQLSKANRRR